MPTLISSLQNPQIKQVTKLIKRRQRDRLQATLVEGQREIALALASGTVPREAYVCRDIAQTDSALEAIESLLSLAADGKTLLRYVTRDVFAKIAYRTDSGGILLVIPYTAHSLNDLTGVSAAFLIVVEGVEKPGNLGAILRTADAAGVDGVVISSGVTDIHNPNVIRASLGALFSVRVMETTTQATIDWLLKRRIKIVIATPQAEIRYTHADLTGPLAIVLGSEATGLSSDWTKIADAQVYIPMHGIVDSLNLSTSAALLLYEALRQREG
jgi:TrmH family RNA methyltransferase